LGVGRSGRRRVNAGTSDGNDSGGIRSLPESVAAAPLTLEKRSFFWMRGHGDNAGGQSQDGKSLDGELHVC